MIPACTVRPYPSINEKNVWNPDECYFSHYTIVLLVCEKKKKSHL